MIFKKPHRHAAFIHAYADGAKIQMMDNGFAGFGNWIDLDQPDWSADIYRIKPEPEGLYPKSTLGYGELCDIVNAARKLPGGEGEQTKIARLAADTAIAAFIESGELKKYVDEFGAL
jgi:hypothetical protein